MALGSRIYIGNLLAYKSEFVVVPRFFSMIVVCPLCDSAEVRAGSAVFLSRNRWSPHLSAVRLHLCAGLHPDLPSNSGVARACPLFPLLGEGGSVVSECPAGDQ